MLGLCLSLCIIFPVICIYFLVLCLVLLKCKETMQATWFCQTLWCLLLLKCFIKQMNIKIAVLLLKKGTPVHVAPPCTGPDHFGSSVRSLSQHFCKMLFLGIELMTSWSQGSSFTAAPGLPFKEKR
jgi:hypothetical protein